MCFSQQLHWSRWISNTHHWPGRYRNSMAIAYLNMKLSLQLNFDPVVFAFMTVFFYVVPCFMFSFQGITHQADRAEAWEHKASQRISTGLPETCQCTFCSRVYCMDLALPTFLKLCSLDTLVGGTNSSWLEQRETVGPSWFGRCPRGITWKYCTDML